MLRTLLALVAIATLVPSPRLAAADFEVQTMARNGVFQALSPSGRFAVVIGESGQFRLHDTRENETIDLPGLKLTENNAGFGLRMNDVYIVWKRIPINRGKPTELVLYDIAARTLTPISGNVEVRLAPILLDEYVVWNGFARDRGGPRRNQVFISNIEDNSFEQITHGGDGINWLAADGTTVAWAADRVPFSHHTTVFAHDLVTGRTQLLEQSELKKWDVRVSGSTITWNTGSPTLFVNAAAPFPECSDGVDNDGDGFLDGEDPACTGPRVASELPRHDVAIVVLRRGKHRRSAHHRLTVAVLGSPRVDVATLDPASFRFGPAGAEPERSKGAFEFDVNRDGFTDLRVRFRADEAGLVPGDAEACLDGLIDGVPFEACGALP